MIRFNTDKKNKKNKISYATKPDDKYKERRQSNRTIAVIKRCTHTRQIKLHFFRALLIKHLSWRNVFCAGVP